jgi:hypothetical protein
MVLPPERGDDIKIGWDILVHCAICSSHPRYKEKTYFHPETDHSVSLTVCAPQLAHEEADIDEPVCGRHVFREDANFIYEYFNFLPPDSKLLQDNSYSHA